MPSAARSHFKTATIAACAAGIAALLAAPVEAAAKRPAYLGAWGIDAQACRSGETDLVISRKEWGSVDFVCRIRSVSGGNGVWHANLFRCRGDGVSKTDKVTIWATATRATTLYASAKFRSNFVRCR